MNRLVFALTSITLAACSRAASLDGAHAAIPVFGPSSVVDEGTGSTGANIGDLKYAVHTWMLATSSDWQEVDGFYKTKLASAERKEQTDEEHTSAVFTYRPDGFAPDEEVKIRVYKEPEEGKTRFDITETTLKKRPPKS